MPIDDLTGPVGGVPVGRVGLDAGPLTLPIDDLTGPVGGVPVGPEEGVVVGLATVVVFGSGIFNCPGDAFGASGAPAGSLLDAGVGVGSVAYPRFPVFGLLISLYA